MDTPRQVFVVVVVVVFNTTLLSYLGNNVLFTKYSILKPEITETAHLNEPYNNYVPNTYLLACSQ